MDSWVWGEAAVPAKKTSALSRHAPLLVALALAPLAIWLQVFRLQETQPGFYLDESANTYDAFTIATHGVDEFGTAWPIFFRSFGDPTAGPLIYLLAVVFKVAGPSILAARLVVALAGLLTAAVLGWLAVRITDRPAIGFITAVSTLLTPQLFEVSRLVFEAALMPLAVAAFMVILQARQPERRWSWLAVVGLGLGLGAITYSYKAGLVLAPLLAVGLLLYYRRSTWANLPRTWVAYALTLAPMLAYSLTNPGPSLLARFDQTGYLNGLAMPDIVARFVHQYLADVGPAQLLLLGDRIQRHHVAGIMGSILVATLVLAIIGIDRIANRFPQDPWWRFAVYGLVVSVVPAALTSDESHALRLIAIPVFLIVLTVPAQAWLLEESGRRATSRALFAVLVAALLIQGTYFQVRFQQLAPLRGAWFDQEYPRLFDEAVATGSQAIYLVDGGGVPGYIHGYWYAVLRGFPTSRLVHLTDGEKPPSGAVVISSEPDCGACRVIDSGGFFKLYRVP